MQHKAPDKKEGASNGRYVGVIQTIKKLLNAIATQG
jgi:hypothetical protein